MTNKEWIEYYRFHPSEFDAFIKFCEGLSNKNENLEAQLSEANHQNAELQSALESIDALIEEDMGEWFAVEYEYIPTVLSNRAHIRDAIAAILEEE
jgi:hypothetical protein